MKKRKVISLVPAATELLFEMGLGSILVGRSDACDFPESANHLPTCSRSVIHSEKTSLQIHQEVTLALQTNRPLFTLDEPLINRLRPDSLIVQSQCSICAVAPEHAGALSVPVPQIHFSPLKFSDLWTESLKLGEALGYPDEARELVKKLKARVVDTLLKIGAPSRRPRTLFIEWLNPMMTAGNWIPDMVTMAGGEPLAGKSGVHSGWVTPAEALSAKPEKLILAPCGFSIEKTENEFLALRRESAWAELLSVTKGECYIADGNQYFNRPGPRLVDSFEILAEILNPKLPRNFLGKGFVKLR